jgi:hypothetical protein
LELKTRLLALAVPARVTELLAQRHTIALVGFRTLERLSDEVICLAELRPPRRSQLKPVRKAAPPGRVLLRSKIMPRYFFNITQGKVLRPPDEGMELPDDAAAWEEATTTWVND